MKNEITSDLACLVDADDIEHWKGSFFFESCEEILRNYFDNNIT